MKSITYRNILILLLNDKILLKGSVFMTDYFDLIKQRESCRNYLDKQVEKEKLIACIEACRIAPSSCNGQPWKFIVVNNKELSIKVAKCLQDWVWINLQTNVHHLSLYWKNSKQKLSILFPISAIVYANIKMVLSTS